MGTLGNLIVQISANSARLQGDMRKAQTTVDKAMAGIRKSIAAAGRAFATLGVGFSAAALVSFGAAAAQQADEISKLSTRLGASTEALSQYQFVAEQTGVSFNTLTTAFQRMTRRVGEAAQGTGEARNALFELGVDAQKLVRLRPEQQFEVLADAFAKVGSQSDKVRLAFKIFDTEGVSLLQTMEGGAEAIRGLREQADALGVTLSGEAAAGAADLIDQMGELRTLFRGVANEILSSFLPALDSTSKNTGGFIDAVRGATQAINAFLGSIAGIQASGFEFVGKLIPGFDRLASSLRGFQQERQAAVSDSLVRGLDSFGSAANDAVNATTFLDDALKRKVETDKAAAAATKESERASRAAASASRARQQAITGVIDSLQFEVSQLGLSNEQQAINNSLRSAGVAADSNSGQIIQNLVTQRERLASAIQRETELKAQQADADRALQAAEESRLDLQESAIEGVQRQVALFGELSNVEEAVFETTVGLYREFDEGAKRALIANSALLDGLEQTAEAQANSIREAEEAAQRTAETAKQLGFTFSSAFEDAVVEGKKFSDIINSIEKDILRLIARKAVTEPLGNFFSGLFTSSSSSLTTSASGIGSFISGLFPGFNQGTQFAVPGAGGPDSQLMGMNLTPGEIVTVTPRGGEAPTGREMNLTMNFNGLTDVNSFNATKDQIFLEASNAITRAQQRNGA